MKMGIAVWNYPGDPVENTKIFHKQGFQSVSWLGRTFDANSAAEDDRIADCIKETGMKFSIHHRFPPYGSEEESQAFLRGMDHIAAWQQQHGLLDSLTFDFNQPHQLLSPLVEQVLVSFRGSGVWIACEDTPLNSFTYRYFEPFLTPEDRFGILIDAGHMNLRHTLMELHQEQDFIAALTGLPVPLIEVHLSDNHGRVDEHLGLGDGTLPLHGFVRGIKAAGFDAIATVERVPRNESLNVGIQQACKSKERFMQAWRVK